MDYTITYFKWYLEHIGSKYLNEEQMQRVVLRIQHETNINWYFAAMQKLHLIKKMQPALQWSNNTDARKLGIKGEQLVLQVLKSNGWEIIESPSTELRPNKYTCQKEYDIVASWQGHFIRSIEIKTINDSCPFIVLHYNSKIKIDKNKDPRHFSVFVWGNDIYYVRSQNIKYLAGIPNFNQQHLVCVWIVDPTCLTKINK